MNLEVGRVMKLSEGSRVGRANGAEVLEVEPVGCGSYVLLREGATQYFRNRIIGVSGISRVEEFITNCDSWAPPEGLN